MGQRAKLIGQRVKGLELRGGFLGVAETESRNVKNDKKRKRIP
jgi:hypothetical protein